MLSFNSILTPAQPQLNSISISTQPQLKLLSLALLSSSLLLCYCGRRCLVFCYSMCHYKPSSSLDTRSLSAMIATRHHMQRSTDCNVALTATPHILQFHTDCKAHWLQRAKPTSMMHQLQRRANLTPHRHTNYNAGPTTAR